MESLQSGAIDDSFGHMSRLVEQRWFPTLLNAHNDPDAEFHFDMFDVFQVIIGKDLNPADDIVYMNMTSLWHILNWLWAILAGWLIQLNGDVTFTLSIGLVMSATPCVGR